MHHQSLPASYTKHHTQSLVQGSSRPAYFSECLGNISNHVLGKSSACRVADPEMQEGRWARLQNQNLAYEKLTANELNCWFLTVGFLTVGMYDFS